MSAWRRKAIEFLPSKRSLEEGAESPMSLWIALNLVAERAFESRPVDDSTLKGIFAYGRYCWTSPDADVSTAVVVAFFENIVRSAAARADLHRWLTLSEFDGLAEPFRYHLSADVFAELDASFKKSAVTARRAG